MKSALSFFLSILLLQPIAALNSDFNFQMSPVIVANDCMNANQNQNEISDLNVILLKNLSERLTLNSNSNEIENLKFEIKFDNQTLILINIDSVDEKPIEKFHSTKSPTLALALSAILPGLGQIYNESYWKAPAVWGFIGYYGYEWNRLNDNYNYYKQLYKNSLQQSAPKDLLRKYRDFYRDQRDLFAIYFVIAYLANIVDAYVDAHLYDINFIFNQRDDFYIIKLGFRF